MQYKNAYESTKETRDKIQRYNTELSNLKKENQIKQKTLATYEYLIKVPKEGDHANAMKCNHCAKFFANDGFLRKHYAKKHPEKDFEKEYPSPAQVQKQKDVSQLEISDQQKKQYEQLFTNMKSGLTKDIGSNISALEKEVLKIRQE